MPINISGLLTPNNVSTGDAAETLKNKTIDFGNNIIVDFEPDVRSALDASGDLNYNVNTGEFSATIPDELERVLKPVPVSPADNETDVGETPTLDGGTYYSLYDKPHAISRFQVSDASDFSNIVYDSGEIAGTETHQVPSATLLEGQVTYYWRVYYEDEDGVQSEFSDPFEFTTAAEFFDYADPANIGTAVNGGFLVGVVDTVAGTIDSQDDYQTGERYALIVAPKSLETVEDQQWADGSVAYTTESGSTTRWDGLSSTNNIIQKTNSSLFQIFDYIETIRGTNPVPDDGGSDWYVPAMDEFELIYRNLKPLDRNNGVGTTTKTFPGSQDWGYNPSIDPTGAAYTSTTPSQTSVIDFQENGSQAIDLEFYWTSTDAGNGGQAWVQYPGFTNAPGEQTAISKDQSNRAVRPVRRIPL